MSDILIKGMEMPKNCKTCPFSDHEAWCLIPGDWRERYYCPDDERSEYCPLIELPPHGDLVDLSDVVHPNDSMRRMTIDEQLRRTCEGWSADRKQCVVIKAEGSET